MSLGAEGAGATQGLNEYLQQMLEQAKLQQEQQRITETGRHNVADEGLTGRQVDISGRNVNSEIGDRASQAAYRTAQTAAITRGEEDDKKREAGMAGIIADPATPEPVRSFLKMRSTMPKGENIPYQLITEPNGPKQPAGPIEHLADGSLARVSPDNTTTPLKDAKGSVLRGFVAPDRVVVPTDNGFVPRTDVTAAAKAGAPLQPQQTAQSRNRQDMATQVGSHFDDAFAELEAANKTGALGPLAGRTVNELLARKIGSTGNPDTDELLGKLNMDLSALTTGFAALHGRGGAGAAIANKIEQNLQQTHMSYKELHGALIEMQKWVNTYAKPVSHGGAAADSGAADLVWNPDTKSFTKP